MKIYRTTPTGRETADLPEGAVLMEINWRFDEHGNEAPEIVMIDYAARKYRRAGEFERRPWPEHTITMDEIAWRPA